MVVADLSERNANVFYELALRHALKKPVIPRGNGASTSAKSLIMGTMTSTMPCHCSWNSGSSMKGKNWSISIQALIPSSISAIRGGVT